MEEYELEHTGCARQEAVLVRGGNRLCGELTVQGAKNSTLPLLAAALLCEGETVLHNCPALSDVHTAVTILRRLGCRCTHTGDTLTVCADGMTRCDIPHSLMREMRSSIVFLGAILSRCGAHIHGAGESCIVIEGVPHLYGSTYTVMPDRIAAATYMAAAAVTGGTVLLRDVNSEHLLPVLSAFESTGCAVMQSGSELLLRAPQRLKPVRHVRTMPYPGFPTDAQAPVMTMAAVGDGTSIFVENIFESRYKHAGELNRLGAKIKLEGKVAVIEGVPQLSGAPVSAEDLRGGAALVIAGLAAQGETQVMHPQYIDRGYAHFEENLRALGADVYRI